MAKHVHHLHPHWILVTSIADAQGWYRVVFGAVCVTCGAQGHFAAEQSTQHRDGRLLEEGE